MAGPKKNVKVESNTERDSIKDTKEKIALKLETIMELKKRFNVKTHLKHKFSVLFFGCKILLLVEVRYRSESTLEPTIAV